MHRAPVGGAEDMGVDLAGDANRSDGACQPRLRDLGERIVNACQPVGGVLLDEAALSRCRIAAREAVPFLPAMS
jgi:hypothetical protein